MALGFLKTIGKGLLKGVGALTGLGELGKGQAQDRQAEADFALRSAIIRAGMPGARAGDAVQGDILSGVQNVGTMGSGRDLRFTGGLSPSLLSGNTRQLGGQMSRQALMSAIGRGGANDPYASPTIRKPGKMEKFLTGAGIVGGFGDVVNQTGLLQKFGRPHALAFLPDAINNLSGTSSEDDTLGEFYTG